MPLPPDPGGQRGGTIAAAEFHLAATPRRRTPTLKHIGTAAPTLAPTRLAVWRYALRLALLMLGLFTFSCGIVLTSGAGLGLSPWDVLHQGLSLHTPLSFGRSSIVVGGLVI